MMMSPLFKEETSITVTSEKSYFYPNLIFCSKTGSFCSSTAECCYDGYKNTGFRIVHVTTYLACLCLVAIVPEILFQDRKSREVTEFTCPLTVSATDLTVSATESTVSTTESAVSAMDFGCFSNGRLFQHNT